MITESLPLIPLRVVRAMMSAAVPEHSTCTAGTSSSAASLASRESELMRGRRSLQRRGSPAVGGISRQRSGMALLRLTEAQQNDADHDTDGAGQFCKRQALPEQRD